MEKVRPWCGQPSDRGRLRNRTEHFLVVVSVRQIKLTHVGFRAHVKIASRIVSHRIVWLQWAIGCSTSDERYAIRRLSVRTQNLLGLFSRVFRCSGRTCTRHVGPVERWAISLHRRTRHRVGFAENFAQKDKVSTSDIVCLYSRTADLPVRKIPYRYIVFCLFSNKT